MHILSNFKSGSRPAPEAAPSAGRRWPPGAAARRRALASPAGACHSCSACKARLSTMASEARCCPSTGARGGISCGWIARLRRHQRQSRSASNPLTSSALPSSASLAIQVRCGAGLRSATCRSFVRTSRTCLQSGSPRSAQWRKALRECRGCATTRLGRVILCSCWALCSGVPKAPHPAAVHRQFVAFFVSRASKIGVRRSNEREKRRNVSPERGLNGRDNPPG